MKGILGKRFFALEKRYCTHIARFFLVVVCAYPGTACSASKVNDQSRDSQSSETKSSEAKASLSAEEVKAALTKLLNGEFKEYKAPSCAVQFPANLDCDGSMEYRNGAWIFTSCNYFMGEWPGRSVLTFGVMDSTESFDAVLSEKGIPGGEQHLVKQEKMEPGFVLWDTVTFAGTKRREAHRFFSKEDKSHCVTRVAVAKAFQKDENIVRLVEELNNKVAGSVRKR